MTLEFTRRVEVTLRLNGRDLTTVVSPRTTLLDWLREEIGLTGTKKGCNEGACGTCTVLVDGSRMNGCLDPRRAVRGPRGHHRRGPRAERRRAAPGAAGLPDFDAFQCGYCTPGQLVSAVACIAEGHATDDGQRARVDERQHLPLLGLPADHRGRAGAPRRRGVGR